MTTEYSDKKFKAKLKECINYVCGFMLKQGKPCEDTSGCVFKDEELSCAVGCLIPKELYNPKMEMHNDVKGVFSVDNKKLFNAVLKVWNIDKLNLNQIDKFQYLLGELQDTHDSISGMNYRETAWPQIWKAKREELIILYCK